MRFPSTYGHSNVYKDFKGIDLSEYRKRVRYYEKNRKAINNLEFTEYFELLVDYTIALFETAAYQKFIPIADYVVEITIEKNIKFYNGQDLYRDLLFKKAAAYYNTMEFEKAEHILKELVKINPSDEMTTRFLKKATRRRHPKFLDIARIVSIVLFFISAFIIAIEMFCVRPFFEEAVVDQFQLVRTIIFIVGFSLLAGSELLHRGIVNYRIDAFVKSVKEKKSIKK